MAIVTFGFQDSIHVDEQAINSWFPALSTWPLNIDGEFLIHQIEIRVSASAQTNISSSTIRHTLKEFFESFRPHFSASQTEHLKKRLDSLLQTDIHGVQNSGCRSSRQTFLILAFLARSTSSNRLAEALVAFLSAFVYLVAQHETPYHLREWALALHELHGLVYEPNLEQVLSCLMPSTSAPFNLWPRKIIVDTYDPWTRRHPHFLATPVNLLVPRARSTPGYRYPRISSPERWPTSRYPRSAWTSPAIPARAPDYFDDDEYEAIQHEQDLQAIEVDGLNRRIRQLDGTY